MVWQGKHIHPSNATTQPLLTLSIIEFCPPNLRMSRLIPLVRLLANSCVTVQSEHQFGLCHKRTKKRVICQVGNSTWRLCTLCGRISLWCVCLRVVGICGRLFAILAVYNRINQMETNRLVFLIGLRWLKYLVKQIQPKTTQVAA